MSERNSSPEIVVKPTKDNQLKAAHNTKRPVASHQPQRRGQGRPKPADDQYRTPEIYNQSFPVSIADQLQDCFFMIFC